VAPGATPGVVISSITTDGTGITNNAWVLCPVGLTSALRNSTSYTAGTTGNVVGPPLRGLWNKAVDFQWFRVTRAKFVFTGAIGSTATGSITLAAYTDPADVSRITYSTYVSGSSTKTFDLASASSGRELSVNVPVDSSWKRVSSLLSVPGNTYPFAAVDATSVANVNTVADLSFGAVTLNVAGAPFTTFLGNAFLDYDVEFRGVIDSALNG